MRKRYRRRVVGYELLERLGQGGFAEVWRARQFTQGFSREVCIKRARGFDSGVRRGLAEEARLLAMVSHGNIIRLFDVLEDSNGQLELCLEYVDGCDVARLLRAQGGPPCLELLVAVGLALSRALGVLARTEGGVVHRDLSPHNVMLSRGGEVRLIDLGIARAAAREAWTASGVVKGKPMYLSPEQARGEALSPASDVFALGVLIYELASQINPWGTEPWTHPARLSWGPPVQLSLLRPDLPLTFCSVVHELLAVQPSDRPCSHQIEAALLACANTRSVDLSRAVSRAVHQATARRVEPCETTTERTLEVTSVDYPVVQRS